MKKSVKRNVCQDAIRELSWVRVIVLLNLLLSIGIIVVAISFRYQSITNHQVLADDELTTEQFIEQSSFINDSRVRGVAHGRGIHVGLADEGVPHVEVVLSDENEAIITAGKDIVIVESHATEPKDVFISELVPAETYNVYLDSYRNHRKYTANEDGEISFRMFKTHHLAIVQPESEIIMISTLTNGEECTQVGDWDRDTRTCTLFKNVSLPIQIDDSAVTLDCGGFKLVGNEKAAYSVFIPETYNARVRNCPLQHNSFIGIGVSGSTNVVIDSNTFDNKRYGLVVSHSTNTAITNNEFFHGTKYGINSYQSKGNIVEGNDINTSIWGVHTFLHDNNGLYANNTFEAEELRENGGAIYVHSQSVDNIFKNNRINIDGHGFLFEKEADNNKVLNNTIIAKSGSGIIASRGVNFDIPAGANLEIKNNIIRAAGVGILVSLTSQLKIESNRIHHSGEGGIIVEASEDAVITKNRIHDNKGNGIAVFTSPTTRVWRNDIWVNQHYALYADSPIQLSVEEIGNWWGGNCSKGLFTAGVHTNREDIVDIYPFKNAISLNPNELVARPC